MFILGGHMVHETVEKFYLANEYLQDCAEIGREAAT